MTEQGIIDFINKNNYDNAQHQIGTVRNVNVFVRKRFHCKIHRFLLRIAPLFNPVRTLIMKAQYLQSISILSVVRLINKPLILQPFSGTMIS